MFELKPKSREVEITGAFLLDFNKRNNRGIGIYLIDKYKNATAFDTSTSISISNDEKNFISWDE